MAKIDSEKAARVGDFLFRYMRARHRFNAKVDRPLPGHELAALIGQGKTEFDEIYVEPQANPPIAFDGKADDVFDAIIKKRYRAIPFWVPEVVAAWRHYVFNNGPLPRRPGPRGAKKPLVVVPPTPLKAAGSPPDGLDMENARCAWINTSGGKSNTPRGNGSR